MRFKSTLLLLFTLLSAQAQLPADFYEEILYNDWNGAVGMTYDEEGNLFVWEKSGKVYIIDTLGQKLPEPLINIEEEVGNWRDHGLLGFALDPEFRNNGYFYLLYAVDRHYLFEYGTPTYDPDSTASFQASIGRITRYQADANTGFTSTIEGSRKILLGRDHTNGFPLIHESHGVGTLVFGNDGSLLASCGDGNTNKGVDLGGDSLGSYATDALLAGIMESDQDIGNYRAQYLGSLNGKILRLDPDSGSGLPSNPHFDPADPFSAQSRVWARGFRNPFRIYVDPETGSHNAEDGDPGRIYVADVGGSGWEELDLVEKGGDNFGWPLKEGYSPFWGFWNTPAPDNKLAPNPLYGVGGCEQEYFTFQDLFEQTRDADSWYFGNPCNTAEPIPAEYYPQMETSPVVAWGHNQFNLPEKCHVGFFDDVGKLQGVDITGPMSSVESEVFVGASSISGTIYNGNNFPEKYKGAYFHADFTGWIRVFFFDDNQNLIRVEPFHESAEQVLQILQHPKNETLIYLSMKNGGVIRQIEFGGNPAPIAIAQADKTYGPDPLEVQFNAGSSFDPDGSRITYNWDFGDGSSSSESNPIHTFNEQTSEPVKRTVRLTVTDSLGLTDETELIISINNTPPNVDILTPLNNSYYPISGNTRYQLEAAVSDAEFKNEDLEFEWQTFLHHNTHFHPEEPIAEINPTIVVSPLGCEEDAIYWYRIRLKVTDPAGLSTQRESEIFPYCGPPFFEVISLTASAFESKIDLIWQTTNEDNLSSFEIQRGPEFQSLGSVPSNADRNYLFTDNAPLAGENFYRLKVIREDGVFDYSNTISVIRPGKENVEVYPNPANAILNVIIKSVIDKNISFDLFDTQGKRVKAQIWTADPGELFTTNINILDLPNGFYYYQILQADQITTGNIIIAK